MTRRVSSVPGCRPVRSWSTPRSWSRRPMLSPRRQGAWLRRRCRPSPTAFRCALFRGSACPTPVLSNGPTALPSPCNSRLRFQKKRSRKITACGFRPPCVARQTPWICPRSFSKASVTANTMCAKRGSMGARSGILPFPRERPAIRFGMKCASGWNRGCAMAALLFA